VKIIKGGRKSKQEKTTAVKMSQFIEGEIRGLIQLPLIKVK
jgi:hypothetical protein